MNCEQVFRQVRRTVPPHDNHRPVASMSSASMASSKRGFIFAPRVNQHARAFRFNGFIKNVSEQAETAPFDVGIRDGNPAKSR